MTWEISGRRILFVAAALPLTIDSAFSQAKMKRAVFLFLFVFLLTACSTQKSGVERTIEDGVEVILNRIEPHKERDTRSEFSLDKLFSIDTESDDVAETGLGDIASYDVDSLGNIYILGRRTGDESIFKFDNKGKFLLSFGKKGQGPGEIQQASFIFVDHNDDIAVTDSGNNRVSLFSKNGIMKEEKKIASGVISACPLSNGNILVYENTVDPGSQYLINPFVLSDSKLNSIKELDSQKIRNPIKGERLKGTFHIFSWGVSTDKIFTGFQERGYEIFVYDFDGYMVRKIKKEYRPVPLSQAHKDEFMEAFSSPFFDDIRSKIYFPASMPPFLALTADEDGWLYVLTYEEEESSGECFFDLFDPEGVFVGRKSLNVYTDDTGFFVKIRNGRFYSLLEKGSGYKELAVFGMNWQ
jgi:hypothetical protein